MIYFGYTSYRTSKCTPFFVRGIGICLRVLNNSLDHLRTFKVRKLANFLLVAFFMRAFVANFGIRKYSRFTVKFTLIRSDRYKPAVIKPGIIKALSAAIISTQAAVTV